MKRSLTVRLDPELLAAARQCARGQNRTLTNFLETIIRRHVAEEMEVATSKATSADKHQREDL